LKDYVWPFSKVLSTVSNYPLQSTIPALQNALKLIKSDAVEQVFQRLRNIIRLDKSLISQGCLGLSNKSEVK
jgi:hypothetical protein